MPERSTSTLDAIISDAAGFLGYLKQDISEQQNPRHPLNNNPYLSKDPITQALTSELDAQKKSIEAAYRDFEEEVKFYRSMPAGKLSVLEQSKNNLHRLWDKYVETRKKLMERNLYLKNEPQDHTRESRETLHGSLKSALVKLDQLEALHLSAHKNEPSVKQHLGSVVEQVQTIISILQNPQLQFDSTKTAPLIRALQARLVRPFQNEDLSEKMARQFQGLFSPTVISSDSYLNLLNNAWPFGQPEVPERKIFAPSVKEQLQLMHQETSIATAILDRMGTPPPLILTLQRIAGAQAIREQAVRNSPPSTTSATPDSRSPITTPRNNSPTESITPQQTLDLSQLESQLLDYTTAAEVWQNKGMRIDPLQRIVAEVKHDLTRLRKMQTELSQLNPADTSHTQLIIDKQHEILTLLRATQNKMDPKEIERIKDSYDQQLKLFIRSAKEMTKNANKDLLKATQSLEIMQATPSVNISEEAALIQEIKKADQPLAYYKKALQEYAGSLQTQKNEIISNLSKTIVQSITEKVNAINRTTNMTLHNNNIADIFKDRLAAIRELLVKATLRFKAIREPDLTNTESVIQWRNDTSKSLEDIEKAHVKWMEVNSTIATLHGNAMHSATLDFLDFIKKELGDRLSKHVGAAAKAEFLQNPKRFIDSNTTITDKKTLALFELYRGILKINTAVYRGLEISTVQAKSSLGWEMIPSETIPLEEYPQRINDELSRVLSEEIKNLTQGAGKFFKSSSTETRVLKAVNDLQTKCRESLEQLAQSTVSTAPRASP